MNHKNRRNKKALPHLSIIQWNARSLLKVRLEEFREYLHEVNPTIVLLSETFWKKNRAPRSNVTPQSATIEQNEPWTFQTSHFSLHPASVPEQMSAQATKQQSTSLSLRQLYLSTLKYLLGNI